MKKYEEPIITIHSLDHKEPLMITGSASDLPVGGNQAATNQQQPADWDNWSK